MDLLKALGFEPRTGSLAGPTSEADLFSGSLPSPGENTPITESGGIEGALVAQVNTFERRYVSLTRQSNFIHNPLAPERSRGRVPYRDELEQTVNGSLTGMVARGQLGGIGNCYAMTGTLAAELDARGINYQRIVNQGTHYGRGGGEEGPGFGHAYLKVTTPGQELIVDPTIGQFFNERGSPTPGGGWSSTPSVFIGTRAELVAAYQRNMSRAGQSVKDMGAEAFVNAIYGPPGAQAVQQMRPLDRGMIREFQQLRQDFERSR